MSSVLFVTDPWETLDHPKDTTLRWAQESLLLGLETHWADVHSIALRGGQVELKTQKVIEIGATREKNQFGFEPPLPSQPSAFSRICYRTDPPVDLAYIHPLQLLMLGLSVVPGATELVNPGEALLAANEKLEGFALAEFSPPSLVASQWETLAEFGLAQGRAVLKPLHMAQSLGIELLDFSQLQATQTQLEAPTEGFTRPVLLQKYLPGIARGEQRLWFLNGHLLAVARKKPKSGEFRINMDSGGTLEATQLTPAEERAAARIGERLRLRKIRHAAVDLIDGLITDFNITSPGLMAQMEKITGRNLSRELLESMVRPWS